MIFFRLTMNWSFLWFVNILIVLKPAPRTYKIVCVLFVFFFFTHRWVIYCVYVECICALLCELKRQRKWFNGQQKKVLRREKQVRKKESEKRGLQELRIEWKSNWTSSRYRNHTENVDTYCTQFYVNVGARVRVFMTAVCTGTTYMLLLLLFCLVL